MKKNILLFVLMIYLVTLGFSETKLKTFVSGTDSTYNGNIMAEIQNGKYLYSAVSATLFRDPDSWNSVTSSVGR